MYPPLDLRQLHCFVTAAANGTMTAAAERLHLSQSAVSLSVAALERRLGTQLLVRRRARSLLLTPAGRRFLPKARELLSHAEEVQRHASEPHGIAGPLTVGCFSTAGPVVLPALLDSFTRAHPDVAVDFRDGPVPDLEAAMRAGDCDLAILDGSLTSPDVEHEPLHTARPYALFAAGDAMAGRASVALAELAERNLILFSLPPSDAFLLQLFERQGLEPRIRHRTPSHELVRGLVGRGLGYALLLTRPVHDLTHEGLPLAAVPLADDVPENSFVLARVRGAQLSRQAAAFARHCHEHHA
jgi:DNA-binding transcriptional LysR family regulator